MRYLSLPGRILFALIFILSGFTHFDAKTIGYAASFAPTILSAITYENPWRHGNYS